MGPERMRVSRRVSLARCIRHAPLVSRLLRLRNTAQHGTARHRDHAYVGAHKNKEKAESTETVRQALIELGAVRVANVRLLCR